MKQNKINKNKTHTKSKRYLGETLTMVAWLTMVNHGWTMVDNG